jgi:hypothetical protein
VCVCVCGGGGLQLLKHVTDFYEKKIGTNVIPLEATLISHCLLY